MAPPTMYDHSLDTSPLSPSNTINGHHLPNLGLPKYPHPLPNKPHVACILAMARATPPNRIDQGTYADFYFDVTNSADKVELKKKFARICERSGIDTRYSILTEEFLKAHPEFYTPGKPSLEERDAIFTKEVQKLAHQAAEKAISEWGRPTSEITHLIVATLSGVAIPGADVALVKSLGLSPDVNRVMLYMLGCYAGVSALRIAKDLAENNPHARILICCTELAGPTFRAPDEKHMYDLVATALFGDGASAVIVGANPNHEYPKLAHDAHNINGAANGYSPDATMDSFSSDHSGDDYNPELTCRGSQHVDVNHHEYSNEKVLYEIHWAGETLAPDSESIIQGKLKLNGLQFYLDRSLPSLVGKHVRPFCKRVLGKARRGGELGFNDVFWAVHAGGPAILKAVEDAMELEQGKLGASREILRRYGNISASTVLFVLDELARSPHDVHSEWGLAVAFGPGVTIEGALLRRPQ